jgi:hypothetical protein
MNRPIHLIVAVSAACLSLASLPACSSTPRAGAVDAKALENAPFLGTWTSDLDGATLTIESTGIFSIDAPARAGAAARTAVGRWSFDEEAKAVTFTNLSASTACGDMPGTYVADVVRDTVRFTKVKDNCAAREEHMAWGWKKASTKAERSGA